MRRPGGCKTRHPRLGDYACQGLPWCRLLDISGADPRLLRAKRFVIAVFHRVASVYLPYGSVPCVFIRSQGLPVIADSLPEGVVISRTVKSRVREKISSTS